MAEDRPGPATRPTEDALFERLSAIDRDRFVRFLAAVWEHGGWETVVGDPRADADLVAFRADDAAGGLELQLVHTWQVAPEARVDREALETVEPVPASAATRVVITTGGFTDRARRHAAERGFAVVERSDFASLFGGDALSDLVGADDLSDAIEAHLGLEVTPAERTAASTPAPESEPLSTPADQPSSEPRPTGSSSPLSSILPVLLLPYTLLNLLFVRELPGTESDSLVVRGLAKVAWSLVGLALFALAVLSVLLPIVVMGPGP